MDERTTKRCSWCKETKPLTEFRRRTPKRVQSFCRVCQNTDSKKYYQQHKAVYVKRANRQHEAIRQFVHAAKDRPCADCGVRYPHYVMDFDHREGEVKLFNISSVLGGQCRSIRTVKAEVAKCDVVCANCHRTRTHQRDQYRPRKNNVPHTDADM